MPGAGEGDAEGVEAAEEGMYVDSGVLFPAVVGGSPSEYLDSSLRGMLGTRSGSGSAFCPGDLGL